jgi:predicted PurR-regulated permease PerM
MDMPQKIEISHRTIIFTVLFLLLLWFLFQIRQILVIFFVGLIVMSALNPLAERLEKWKIPRVLTLALIYLGILALISLVVAGLIPPLVSQTSTLVSRFPQYLDGLNLSQFSENILDKQMNQFLHLLESISGNLMKIIGAVFGNFVVFFTVIFVSFYLLLERKKLDDYLFRFFGHTQDKKIAQIIYKVETRLGEWVRAQLTLMIIVGIMSYLGLRILGIDYALPLALLAGVLEIVPNIGPVLSAIPAVLVGLLISPLMGLAVVALYFLVQQLENNLIVPQIMAKETGINPLITILALLAGFQLGRITGTVLAVPLVILAETLIKELIASDKFKKA